MRRLLFFLLIIFSELPVFSQELGDSLFVAGVLKNAKESYASLLNRVAPIYNGREYNPSGPISDNDHFFFIDDVYASGTIGFEGYIYKNVKIKYELVKDQLVLLHFDGATPTTVIPAQVDFFSLHNHTFINLKASSERNEGESSIKPGYYDQLYSGKISLLAKRVKSVAEKITPTQVEKHVFREDKYYLFKNSRYLSIKSKKALLKQLRSTQAQNQEFIKKNQLNFKKDKEKAMVELVRFHDSIVQL
ncbi:hypothetical protein [Desertivirga brevis]|uniref:hypothetical protein n=1 Tax=Desertivirga brevis TaxID=2810310 RepID=UPI001A968342|nr:hypothetical protein [Pedobacter sp. SYSU D00873]